MKSEAVRTLLREKQRGLCCYCDKVMVKYHIKGAPKGGFPLDMETFEHLHRKIDGGNDRTDNLALACYECNTGRGLMDWFTYKSYRQGELFI